MQTSLDRKNGLRANIQKVLLDVEALYSLKEIQRPTFEQIIICIREALESGDTSQLVNHIQLIHNCTLYPEITNELLRLI